MTLLKLFAALESMEFANEVSVASSKRMFVNAVSRTGQFADLCERSKSAEVASHVLGRIAALCQLEVDYRYQHPQDVALAAYLLALSASGSSACPTACEVILGARQTWWAKRIAAELAHAGAESYASASRGSGTDTSEVPANGITVTTGAASSSEHIVRSTLLRAQATILLPNARALQLSKVRCHPQSWMIAVPETVNRHGPARDEVVLSWVA